MSGLASEKAIKMYQNCCKKCGSTSFHTEVKGNNTGLYCDGCGAWVKWLGKDELRAFNHLLQESIDNHAKFIDKLNDVRKEVCYGESIEIRLKEFITFLDKKINAEYEKLPISSEDAIRKNAYCLALQQDICALENILNGRDWNYKE